MIRALWNEHVPVAGADRLKLGENIAVLDLMALAQFALMPEDDHALACILKSPVLPQPLSEDELMAAAAGRGSLSLCGKALGSRRASPLPAPCASVTPHRRSTRGAALRVSLGRAGVIADSLRLAAGFRGQ